MPRSSQHPKETSFNLRIDPALKAAFTAAAQAEDKPAAQIVRDFMRAYVKQQERRAYEADIERQCRALNAPAKDPTRDANAERQGVEGVADI